jgi:hypothetical protein
MLPGAEGFYDCISLCSCPAHGQLAGLADKGEQGD